MGKMDRPYNVCLSGFYFPSKLTPEIVSIQERVIDRTQSFEQHDEIELLLVTGGSGKIEVNEFSYDLKSGSLIALYLYHIHRIVPSSEQPIHTVSIHIPYSTYLFLLTAPNVTVQGDSHDLLHAVLDDISFGRFLELVEQIRSNSLTTPIKNMYELGCIAEMFGLLMQIAGTE